VVGRLDLSVAGLAERVERALREPARDQIDAAPHGRDLQGALLGNGLARPGRVHLEDAVERRVRVLEAFARPRRSSTFGMTARIGLDRVWNEQLIVAGRREEAAERFEHHTVSTPRFA
jgi:hypothetical protein